MLPLSQKDRLLSAIERSVLARAEVDRLGDVVGGLGAHIINFLLVGALVLLIGVADLLIGIFGLNLSETLHKVAGITALMVVPVLPVLAVAIPRWRARERRLQESLAEIEALGFTLEKDRPYRLRRRSDDTIWNVADGAVYDPRR